MKCPSLSSSRHGGEPFRANPFTFTEEQVWSEGALEDKRLVTSPTSCPHDNPS